MKLSERLREVEDGATGTVTSVASLADPKLTLKHRVQEGLYAALGVRLYDASLSDDELRTLVLSELSELLAEERVPLSSEERTELVDEIATDVLGLGPLEQFLADPEVTEVMANGTRSIYVERAGRLHRTDARFVTDEQIRRVIDRIVSRIGRRIDESSPMVDARLADGSRVNAVIPPLAVDGPSLTVRKFSREALGTDDLVRFGTLTAEMAELLRLCVLGRRNILVSGGTGSGKTTMLNVLSSFIPEEERIVTIEDAVELKLQQEHLVRLESRPANIEGRGAVEIRDLVRNALRMRPDRIIVGEVRGGEALDMLAAMNTGHDGSLSTVHANAPREAISRLETMVLMAGIDLPARAIREQIAAAIDLVVHVSRLRDGSRRVTHITEIVGMEGDVVTTQDIYLFDFAAGVDADGHFLGMGRPTGIRPRFGDQLADLGYPIPAELLGAPTNGGRR